MKRQPSNSSPDVNRRAMLGGVGVMAAALGVGSRRSRAAAHDESGHDAKGHPIVGGWQWTNSPGTEMESITIAIFTSDGTYIEVDTNVGVGIGVWEATGDRTLNLTIFFQDTDPDQAVFTAGLAKFRIALEVDETGNSMSGAGDLEVRDSAGELVTNLAYAGQATRLMVEAPVMLPEATPEA